MTDAELAVTIATTTVAASGLVGGAIWRLARTIEKLTSSFEANQRQCQERHDNLDEDRQERCVWLQNVEGKIDAHINWHAQK